MDNTKETKVQVQTREWANPTPAGLVALAVACFCFFALLNGFVTKDAMPLLGCWLVGGFLVQLVVALLDLKGGNHAGGNTFLYFSAFFMLAGGMEMFVKSSGAAVDARIDGWAWSALSLVVILWSPAFFKTFGFLSLIILALIVACPMIALIDLGVLPKTLSPVPGYALLAAALVAIYYSAALVVNAAYGKKIYPVM